MFTFLFKFDRLRLELKLIIMNRDFGKFIVIEGDDGAGKTTVIEFLKEELKRKKVVFTYEPGGGGGDDIREFFFRKETRKYNWRTQLLLVSAARAENIVNVIVPNIEKGINVISDRYEASTFAFQLPDLQPLNIAYFCSISGNVVYGAIPTLYIYLNLKPEDAVKRLASSNKELNSLDVANTKIKKERHKAYLYFFKNIRKMKGTVIIDANKPKNEVCAEVLKIVKAHLKGREFNGKCTLPSDLSKFYNNIPAYDFDQIGLTKRKVQDGE